MKGSRIKIGAVWPHKGVDLRIQPNLAEEIWITERAIQRSGQHWPKVDFTHHAVTKRNPKAMRANNLEVCDAMKCVNHVDTSGSGSIGRGSAPACNRPQSATNSD